MQCFDSEVSHLQDICKHGCERISNLILVYCVISYVIVFLACSKDKFHGEKLLNQRMADYLPEKDQTKFLQDRASDVGGQAALTKLAPPRSATHQKTSAGRCKASGEADGGLPLDAYEHPLWVHAFDSCEVTCHSIMSL